MESIFVIIPNRNSDIDLDSLYPKKCQCCGSSSEPSSYLIHKLRSMFPPSTACKKSRKIYDEYFQDCEDPFEASDLMVKELGEEKADEIQWEVHLSTNLVHTYECKDCAALDDESYHEKRRGRRSEEGSA
jgi:hypothetical protein